MIVQERLTIGETEFIKTYSSIGVKVHGGFPEGDYDDVLDPAEFGRTYTETDIPIDGDENEPEELLNIILGGET